MDIRSLKNIMFEGEELTSFSGVTKENMNIFSAFFHEIRQNLNDVVNQYKANWDLTDFIKNVETYDWQVPHKVYPVYQDDKESNYKYYSQFPVYNKKITIPNDGIEITIINRPFVHPTHEFVYQALAIENTNISPTDEENGMYIVEWNVLNLVEPFKVEMTVDYSRYCKKCLQVWTNKETSCIDENGHDYALNVTLDNVMDTKEAGKMWGLSQDYVKSLCQKGEIKAKKIGRTWIIDKNQPNPKKYDKKFWDTDNLVIIDEIYAPVIGRAKLNDGEANLYEDLKIVESSLRDFNAARKDEEGTRYNIENVWATIDFENKTCKIEYDLVWIGGLVESKKIEFPISWNERKNNDPVIKVTRVTVYEKKESTTHHLNSNEF